MKEKAVIFCRVSSKEQEETGYSLPAQEKLLENYAKNNDFKIEKPFSIAESASGKKQRETFNGMLQFVKKNNIKIIICEKVDRLTRNFKDMVMIDEWLEENEQRQVHLVKDSLVMHKNSRSQEKLNWGIRILFAKNCIDNLSEEVKKGQKEKIAQGGFPASGKLGYKSVGEKGHKTMVINEDQKPYAVKMFELYATGEFSVKTLATRLANDGLRNNNGNRYSPSRIHELLSDPFYIGKIKWNDVIHDGGKQEVFISDELFYKVQSLLKRKNTPKYNKHYHLFRGLIKCKRCIGNITWEKHKGIIYGHCNSNYKGCTNNKPWLIEGDVEKQLISHLQNLQIKSPGLSEWIKKALKETHKDEISYRSNSMSELNNKLDQLLTKKDKLYDDKLDEKISEADYSRRDARYTKEIEEIQQLLSKHTKVSFKYYQLSWNFYEISQRGVEIYKKRLTDDKRKLVSLVFEKLIVDKGNLFIRFTKPFQLLADAVAATNSSKMKKVIENNNKILEPAKNVDIRPQMLYLQTQYPVVLPREDSNL